MANRWWLGTTTDLNASSNWSATEGGAGGASVPTTGDTACFSNTSGTGNATATAAFACDNIYFDNLNHGGTDDWSGTLDMATYGLTVGWDFIDAAASTIDLGTGTHTISGDMILTGNLDLATCALTVNGEIDFSGLASITEGTSTITKTGASTLTLGTSSVYHLVINASGTVTVGSALDINGNLSVTGGTLDTNLKNLDVAGTTTTSAGTTVDFDTGNHTLTGNVTLDGTITCGSSTINAAGDFNASAVDTLNKGTSTIVFNGSGAQSVNLSGQTVYNLSVTNTSAAISFTAAYTANKLTLTDNTISEFVNGSTFTITTLDWQGSAGNLVTVRSNSAGSSYTISSTGTKTISYVSFKDTKAANANAINATDNCTNVSGNSNIVFSLGGVVNSQFDPFEYAAGGLNALSISSSVTIDTDAGTITGWSAAADSFYPELSESENVMMGVFRFTSISITSGTITVTGNKGLALLSQGDITISSGVVINVKGTNGSSPAGGAGGSGGEGDTKGGTFNPNSAPPPSTKGKGGQGGTSIQDGFGQGGGTKGTPAGGGGAYGGAGGAGNGAGGVTYGDNLLANLYGGSGGGGGGTAFDAGLGGGGGGGSIELVSSGTLTLDGTINAYGGNGGGGSFVRPGGGGSGGGVLLSSLTLSFSGTINAYGGNGGAKSNGADAGGGGGGRVAFYIRNGVDSFSETDGVWTSASATVSVAGGTSVDGNDGSNGTFQPEAGDYPFLKYWWKNSDVDSDLNNGNNWNTKEDGSGTSGTVPSSISDAYFSNTASSANATASAAFSCANMYFDNADHGGTDDYTGTLDMATYGLTVSGTLKNAPLSTVDFGSGTHDLADVTLDGTIDLASCTMDSSGNFDMSLVDSLTYGTSSVTLSGTSKTITTGASARDFATLIISGTISMGAIFVDVNTALTVSGTLTNTGGTLSVFSAATMTLTGGTITGTGGVTWFSTAKVPSDGTLSVALFKYKNLTSTIPARTWDCNLSFHSNGTAVFDAGTHTLNGDLINTDMSTEVTTLDFNTNDPTVAVNGNVNLSDTDGTLTVNMGSSTWSVSGNWNTAGVDVWDRGTSSVDMTGASTTITLSTASNLFNDLSISENVSTVAGVGTLFVYGTLTVDVTKTFTLNNNLRFETASNLVLNGGIAGGSATLTWASANAFPATGTITTSKVLFLDGTSPVPARTFGCTNLNFGGTATYVFGATLALTNMNLETGGGDTLTLDFATNSTVVTGNFISLADTDGTTTLNLGASSWTTTGSFSITGIDTANLGSASLSITGFVNVSGPTLNAGTSTVTMTANVARTLTFGGNSLYNLTINATNTVSFVDQGGVSGTLDMDAGTLDMNGQIADLNNITSSGGIITFGAATHTISGNCDLSGLASYTATYLTFDGTGTQSINLAAGTVTTVEVTNASNVVTFTESFSSSNFLCTTPLADIDVTTGKQIDVTTLLRLYGDASNNMSLTGSGGAFNLNATAATREVGRVTLTNVNNNSGSNITVSFGTDGTGNSNFDFVNAFVWDGGGGDNLFTTAGNWVGDIAPTTGNAIYFDGTSTKDCTWDDATSFTLVTINTGYSGTVTTSEHITATVGVVVNAGTLTLGASKNLVVGYLTLGASSTFNATSSNSITATGNVTVNSGATTDFSGVTLTINGTGVQAVDLGTKTVPAVTITNSTALVSVTESFTSTTFTTNGASVQVTAAKTITTTNISFTNTVLTSSGAAWNLIVSGTQTVTGVTASDSDASGGNQILANDGTCTDGGGNTNWDFGVVEDNVDLNAIKRTYGGALAVLCF